MKRQRYVTAHRALSLNRHTTVQRHWREYRHQLNWTGAVRSHYEQFMTVCILLNFRSLGIRCAGMYCSVVVCVVPDVSKVRCADFFCGCLIAENGSNVLPSDVGTLTERYSVTSRKTPVLTLCLATRTTTYLCHVLKCLVSPGDKYG